MRRLSSKFSSFIEHLSFKTLALVAVLLLIGITVLVKFNGKIFKADAAWWNESWQYRKTISISNTSGSNQTNVYYKILANADLSSLVTAGKLQSNLNDLRFTDINGNLIEYWIESATSNSVIVWAQIPSIPTSGTTVYMYYGNSYASSVSDSSIVPISCSKINASFGTGLYYVNPTNHGNTTPVQAYCDMTSDGGGWTLVASWATAQEWTKTSVSSAAVFDTTPKNAVSSNFGNLSISDFRILASDTVTNVGATAYADWYYRYNTQTTWKEVWAPSSNLGGDMTHGYRSTTPRQALKPFNSAYNLKFAYSVAQTWNNLSDWSYTGTATTGCLPDYWKALTTPGSNFGVYSLATYTGSNGANCSSAVSDGTLGVCPSNTPNCVTGQDVPGGNTKVGYDDGGACSAFAGIGTTNVGSDPGVQTTTKLWWFIRSETPPTINGISIGQPSTTEEQSPSPVGYWSLDEGTGTTAFDSSQNKNNGVITGATWANEDQCAVGKCLNFTGTGSINVGTSSIFNFGTGDFTISTWFKANTVGNSGCVSNPIIMKGATTAQGYALGIDWGQMKFWANGTSIGYSYPDDKKWHYLVAVRTQTQLMLYDNGVLKASTSSTPTDINTTDSLGIGKPYCATSANGFIDEPKLYNYSISSAQIKANYSSGLSHSATNHGITANFGSNAKNNDSLNNGLTGYWKLDDGVGSTAVDSSGNNKNGAVVGTSSWIPAKFGVGISFGGANYIDLGTSVVNETAYTKAAWIKTTSSSANNIFSGNSGGHVFYLSGGLIYLSNTWSSPSITASANFYDNNWHLIVVTYNGSKGVIYMDGVKLAEGALPNIPASQPSYIGAYAAANQFVGQIDEVRLYNRALDPTEVGQLYNWAPNPVAYWDFNDTKNTTLQDKSGLNNNGTWSNSNNHVAVGKYGSAGQFNGSNDNVSIPNPTNNSLNLGTGDFTVSYWINYHGITTVNQTPGTVINKTSAGSGTPGFFSGITTYGGNGSNYGIIFSTTNGAWGTGNLEHTGAYLPNTWYHITGVRSGNKLTIYKNGVYATSNTLAGIGVDVNNSLPVTIGSGAWGSANMNLDDVRIYNYARSQRQIIEDMNGGHPIGGSPVGSQIGYWKFDEGFGNVSSNTGNQGSSLDASISNAAWTTDGKFNRALIYNGSTSLTSVNTTLPLNSEATFTGWFKINSFVDWASVFGNFKYNGNTTPLGMNFIPFNGFIRVCTGTGSGAYLTNDFTSTDVALNKWIYGAVVYNGSQIKVYVNGKLIGTASRTVNLSGTNFAIGRWATDYNGYYFPGTIDEVKIYNTALSDEDIKIDYNRGTAMQLGSLSTNTGSTAPPTAASQEYCVPGDSSACTPPINEWRFNEKAGAVANDTGSNSNNGNLGSGSSAPAWTQGKLGASLKFDGVDDAVTLTSTINLNSAANWTVSAWVKTGSSALNSVLSNSSGGPVANDIGINNSKIYYAHYNAAWYYEYGTKNIANNSWHYLTWVNYSNGTMDMYVDGVKDAIGVNSVQTTGPVNQIGRNWYLTANAYIDQVRIYNYARTPAQVSWEYNRGNPVGWWKFDECHNTTIGDWSFNGNNGSLSIGAGGSQTSVGTCTDNLSTSAWSNGKSGKYNSAMSFDGTDDRVTLPNDIGLGSQELTVSAWVNYRSFAPSGSSRPYVSDWNSWAPGAQKGFILRSYDTQNYPSFWLADGTNYSTVYSSKTLNLNTWYHIVGVFKANSIFKIYVNGVETGSAAAPSQYVKESTTPIYIGYGGINTGYFDGLLDDARVYNYALTPDQIKTLFNNGAASFNQ